MAKKSSKPFLDARGAANATQRVLKRMVAAERQLDALLLAAKRGRRVSRDAERVFNMFSRLSDEALALDTKYGIGPRKSSPKRGRTYRDLVRAERLAGVLKR